MGFLSHDSLSPLPISSVKRDEPRRADDGWLFQNSDFRGRLVVEPRAVVTSRQGGTERSTRHSHTEGWTTGNHCIADFLDGRACALIGDAGVSVAIENLGFRNRTSPEPPQQKSSQLWKSKRDEAKPRNDRRPQLWSDHAVEINHARLARSIVAGVVA